MEDAELQALKALAKEVATATAEETAKTEEMSPPVPRTRSGSGGGSGPGVPKLPPKTQLDLSQPTVSAPSVPDFTIPPVLSVAADSTAVVSPANLTQLDWLVVARNSRILYAYTMGEVGEDGEPPQARRAALDWLVPDSNDFMESMELQAKVLSAVTFTAETASYVRAGFDKQQASAGFPFAAASFEREHKERQAGASYRKQLQMIGRWHYPRVKLKLQLCATASERFKTAIRTALDIYDTKSDIKPLVRVFEEFGTAVPTEVILGGQMLLVHTENCQGTVNERDVENVISAAVSIKTDKAEGSAGATFQNAQGTKVSADSVTKSTTFTVRGGDATRVSDPQTWPATVKPPSQWAVIGRSKLTSVVEWLPDDLRARVMALWPKVPVSPAVWDVRDTLAQGHSAVAKQAQFVLGSQMVLPEDQAAARGEVRLVCGTATTPELGRGDAAGGGASVHRNYSAGVRVNVGTVCLPVPAGHTYTGTPWVEVGTAPVRFAIAETNLTLGRWRLLEENPAHRLYRGFDADTDGFVFCSLEAKNEGDRGYATCEVDGTVIAAAAVHDNHRRGCCIDRASFCAPYAKGSRVEVRATQNTSLIRLNVWQIPSTSNAWKFTKPEAFNLRTFVTAETDGFLNGTITVLGDLSCVSLRLDCIENRQSFHGHPLASAYVNFSRNDNNWISHSSAMIPVRKDYVIYAEAKYFAGPDSPAVVQAQAYWTRVVPNV